MKSVIILLLLMALAAAAFFTRPSAEDFKSYINTQVKAEPNAFKRFFKSLGTDHYVKTCSYKDRYLWVTEERDGKTVFVGAFTHWFPSDADAAK